MIFLVQIKYSCTQYSYSGILLSVFIPSRDSEGKLNHHKNYEHALKSGEAKYKNPKKYHLSKYATPASIVKPFTTQIVPELYEDNYHSSYIPLENHDSVKEEHYHESGEIFPNGFPNFHLMSTGGHRPTESPAQPYPAVSGVLNSLLKSHRKRTRLLRAKYHRKYQSVVHNFMYQTH